MASRDITALVKNNDTSAAKNPLAVTDPDNIPTHQRLDPTRYGDWELNGKCVDF